MGDLKKLLAAYDAVDPETELQTLAAARDPQGLIYAAVAGGRTPAMVTREFSAASQLETEFLDKHPEQEANWQRLKAKRYPWTEQRNRLLSAHKQVMAEEPPGEAMRVGIEAAKVTHPFGVAAAPAVEAALELPRQMSARYVDPFAAFYGKDAAQAVRDLAASEPGVVGSIHRVGRGALSLYGMIKGPVKGVAAATSGLLTLKKMAGVAGAAARHPTATAITKGAVDFALPEFLSRPEAGQTRLGAAAHGAASGLAFGAAGALTQRTAQALLGRSTVSPLA
ncbi:MAG: hypothetical protein FJ296_00695, partial [Planctomycetes bacterium]|nr:hypothetical protein [Planctomycetota bacterium]